MCTLRTHFLLPLAEHGMCVYFSYCARKSNFETNNIVLINLYEYVKFQTNRFLLLSLWIAANEIVHVKKWNCTQKNKKHGSSSSCCNSYCTQATSMFCSNVEIKKNKPFTFLIFNYFFVYFFLVFASTELLLCVFDMRFVCKLHMNEQYTFVKRIIDTQIKNKSSQKTIKKFLLFFVYYFISFFCPPEFWTE